MKFEKRDIILIAGLVLFMIGLLPFMPLFYALVIVGLMYFGIKFYIYWQRQAVAGRTVCMECGAMLDGNACPHCRK